MENKVSNKYLVMYLAMSFVTCWGIGIAYMFFADIFVPITGKLTLMHPIAILALYSPSIAGLITYYLMGGSKAVKSVFKKLVPRKQDLFWYPVILGVFALFATSMHFGSILFGISVPEITYTPMEIVKKALWNLIEETGLIGGVFGWIAFLLPFLQAKFKNNISSALITGLTFGLWVLPGYTISSFGTQTSYLYYVIQLMVFVLFQSYIFNATKGNISFYLFSFWLAATGSRVQLYYFNSQVQLLQISYFVIAAIVIHFVFKTFKVESSLQKTPEYILQS